MVASALHGDVGYLGEPLIRYRRHRGNETNAFGGIKGIEHEFRAKRAIIARYGERVADRDDLMASLSRRCCELAVAEVASRSQYGASDLQALFLAIPRRSPTLLTPWAPTSIGLDASRKCW